MKLDLYEKQMLLEALRREMQRCAHVDIPYWHKRAAALERTLKEEIDGQEEGQIREF